jgi:hypothetical protein
MLVEVVCLRREGVKLPPEELRAVKPVRGYLTIDTVSMGTPAAEARPVRKELARLWQPDVAETPRPVDGLECASISRVGGDALLVVGVESIDEEFTRAGHPQAWWCRVLLEGEADEPLESGDTGWGALSRPHSEL